MRKGWETKKLKEVCDKITDGTHQTPKYFDEGVIFLSSRNVTSGKIDWDNIKYIDEAQHIEMHKRVAPRKGDILLAKNGTTGVAAMVDKDIVFDIYVSLAHIRVLDKITPEFMLYFINSPLAKEQFNSRLKGVGVPNLHLQEIREVEIHFPKSLEEQQQIVAILDQAFEAIDQAKANIEKNIANAKELFENTLQKLFDKKDWDLKRLGEIATFKNGMNFTNSSKGQSIEIVGVKNFKNNFWVPIHELENVILDGEMSELYQLKKGDILTVRSNGNPKLIGRTLLADEVSSIVSHSGFTIRIRLNSNTILPTFLCHFLKTAKTIKELVDSGNGVGIKSLNQVSLSSLMIPFPESEQEQQIIVDKIEEISIQTKQIESHYKQKLNNLEDLKKSILQKAFAGALTSPERTQYSKDGRSPSV